MQELESVVHDKDDEIAGLKMQIEELKAKATAEVDTSPKLALRLHAQPGLLGRH